MFADKQSTLISNSFYLYISHFSDYLFSIFLIPFVARTIGIIEFGKIGAAQTFGILILLVMEFGSTLMATREISRIKQDKILTASFIGKIYTIKLMIIPIVLSLFIVATITVPIFSENRLFLSIAMIGSVFQGISPSWYFQGIEKMKKIALSKLFFRLTGFFIIFVFVKNSEDSWIVLTAFTFSSVLTFFYLFLKMKIDIGLIKLSNPRNSLVIFWDSIYSFFITLLPVISQNINLILLSIYINPFELGYYFGASRIYRAFNTLFGPFSQAFFPVISAAQNSTKKIKLIKNYTVILFIVGIIFFLAIYFFAESFVLLLLGRDFLSSADLLKLFCFVLPLTAISNSIGRQWLMSQNKDKVYALIQFFSTIFSIVVFIYIIKDFGSKAAPISLIFYEMSTILIILVYLVKNVIK